MSLKIRFELLCRASYAPTELGTSNLVCLRTQERIRDGNPRLRASASRAVGRTVVCPLEASEICRRGTIHNWASRSLRPFRAIRRLAPASQAGGAPRGRVG